MRYLFGFLCVCALVGSPLSVSAQAGEEGTEPTVEEPASSSEPAPEEPALQLKLDAASVEVTPSPLRTADGYTLEEMQLRVKRARIGLLSSAGAFVGGIAFFAAAGARSLGSHPVTFMGVALFGGGTVGMIASGIVLGKRNRELDRFKPVWTVDSDTLEEMQLRVKRARIGLGASAGSMVLGTVLSVVAAVNTLACFDSCPGWVDPVFAMGMTLAVGGAAGMVVSGILLGKRKRKLRRLQHAHYGTPRRVQWDLARSRVVF